MNTLKEYRLYNRLLSLLIGNAFRRSVYVISGQIKWAVKSLLSVTFQVVALIALAGFMSDEVIAENVGKDSALKHAKELLARTPLIDGHNDLPWLIRTHPVKPMDLDAFDLRTNTSGDTDIPKLRKGQVAAQFWSVYVPADAKPLGFAKYQLEQIDITRRLIEKHPENFELATSADDVEKAFRDGKIASLLGMEGGHAIQNSLGSLRMFRRLGVSYMTLTHSKTTDWADASTDEKRHNGLSNFGLTVVKEMNRIGMIVDISHVSRDTAKQVMEISSAPVIFSHSAAYALTDHIQNVPDSLLLQLAKNDGVIMVPFIPQFVSQEVRDWRKGLDKKFIGVPYVHQIRKKIEAEYIKNHAPKPMANISDVANHIEHIRDLIGVRHVGIGSDFWGSGDTPIGLEDVSKFPYLFAELIQRGWSDAALEALAGKNILRVMRKCNEVSQQLNKSPSTKKNGTDS